MDEEPCSDEERVLILAPTARDAAATREILGHAGIASQTCSSVREICLAAAAGAGAAMLAEEHLLADTAGCIATFLKGQPPWSDFPLVVLLRGGQQTPAVHQALSEIGNMTLTPRPVQIAGLVSTIQAALRDRRRQYAVRDLLSHREQVTAELARDVERRKKIERHLRESEDRFRQLADVIPQLAWTARPDGFIDWYNSRWYEYTGTNEEQMRGWGWEAVHDPEALPLVRDKWKTSLTTGQPFDMVFPIRGADGVYRSFLTRVMPFRDRDGNIVRWFGTNTDITEQKMLQEKLQKVAADLSAADQRKDEFLAMLAHELRNPLAAITSALQLLSWPTITAEQAESSRTIAKRQTEQLKRLIDDLLDISRITRSKIQLRREQFDLADAAERAIEACRPLLESHGHELVISIDRKQAFPVEGDPARMEQVVVNLLTNAAKYTRDRGRITLEIAPDGDRQVLRVRDTGIGIPADLLPTVFDLFAQAPRSLDRAEGGLGIGLTLVKALVELHRGAVSVSSVEGEGSEFVVQIPAAEPSVVPRPAENLKICEPAQPSRQILIVDDNHDSARMMGTLLQTWGHRVEIAHDGPEALQFLSRSAPDFVLLDIGLPGLNGFEVAEQIRRDGSLRQPVIIGISGYGQLEDRRRSQSAGFDAHLVKPVDHAELMDLLGGTRPAARHRSVMP